MKKLDLSVIILAHRDDDRLANAIKSAQFAREVLVVDMSSEEISWPKLKKKFKFKKLNRPQPAPSFLNFSQVRNLVTKQAKYSWVFFLDSDEVITQDSVDDIEKLLRQTNISGALVKRLDFFLGKRVRFGEVSNVWLLRLAKKNSLKYVRPVHEIAQVAGNIKKTNIKLHHHSHRNLREFIDKVDLYASIEANFKQSQNQKFSLLEVIANPIGKFLYNYFFKLGLLDGWRGLIYALVMSLHSLLVRIHFYELKTT